VTALQSSKLLSSLFAKIEDDEHVRVLHIGPALPETIDFFSQFRCKLYFVDLFDELPISANEDNEPSLEQTFTQLLDFESDVQLDICLFWDFFNFLDSDAISAFMTVLKPHLHPDTLAHAFAVHKLRSEQGNQLYGIADTDKINIRTRSTLLPSYAPQPQATLKRLLNCLNFDRSVLLPDGRLELLLQAKL
jgi:hypothetical protein